MVTAVPLPQHLVAQLLDLPPRHLLRVISHQTSLAELLPITISAHRVSAALNGVGAEQTHRTVATVVNLHLVYVVDRHLLQARPLSLLVASLVASVLHCYLRVQ